MTKRQTLVASLATALMIGVASGTIAAAHDRDPGPGMMGQGPYGMGPGYQMGPGMMGQGYQMGPGMMYPGPGTMGPGQQQWRMGPGMTGPGYEMGPGMMGQGYHMGPGYGMMGPGQGQGQSRMGPGYWGGAHYGMRPGMMEPGYGMGPGRQAWAAPRVTPRMNLSTDDVRAFFEEQLAAEGNDRLEVGKVEALDDDTIQAEIVTVDGSLVATYQVDRHTGSIAPAG